MPSRKKPVLRPLRHSSCLINAAANPSPPPATQSAQAAGSLALHLTKPASLAELLSGPLYGLEEKKREGTGQGKREEKKDEAADRRRNERDEERS
ncbi:hypothetical protein M0R45_027078 [Rubus argutus]|uniref:Uncharacterized protein n=1 Tax=Rubus argutus TaxID=59490 RepID=A0AAW1X122_RUBAR